jgi:anaphase-promoting complex subunit 4
VVVNPATETRPVPEYDMLEVNHYLMSGLVVSSIDKWFMGPISQLSPEDLGVPGDKQDLQSILRRAQAVASEPSQIAWQAVGSTHEKVVLESRVLMQMILEHHSKGFITS